MSHRVFVLGQGLPSLERIPAALVEEGFVVEVLAEAEGFEERLVAAHPSLLVLSRAVREPPPQEVIRRIRREPSVADVSIIWSAPTTTSCTGSSRSSSGSTTSSPSR